jgi:hypothetical protein
MDFIHSNIVLRVIASVGSRAQVGANGHLCGKSNNGNPYPVRDEVVDGFVDIARVAR